MYATFRYWPDEGMHSIQKYLPVYSEYIWLFNILFYLELIVLVFGTFVEGSVVAKAMHVVHSVEAFNSVRHTVHLKHFYVFWNWRYSIDLQVWEALRQGSFLVSNLCLNEANRIYTVGNVLYIIEEICGLKLLTY